MSKSSIPPWLKPYENATQAPPGGEDTVQAKSSELSPAVKPVEVGPVHIAVVRGLATSQVIMDDDRVRLVIGRGREEADMPLMDPAMSPRQVVILRLGSELLVVNGAPRNPMYVNGVETIQASIPVPSRALVEVANTAILLHADGKPRDDQFGQTRHAAARPGEAHMLPPPDGSAVTLRVDNGPEITLMDRGILVGADNYCDLRFRHLGLANLHFMVSPTGDGITLIPISRDTLKLDGRPVSDPVLLAHDSIIDVGGRNIVVSFTGDPHGRAAKVYNSSQYRLDNFMFRSLFSELAHSFILERNGQPAVVGRGEHCDIMLVESSISREHATLVPNPNNVLVIDENSSNGTFINDLPVSRNRVRAGDLMEFGRNPYLVHYA